MSKMKQYIDLMTPMEAYQKGYDKGQEDVCTVSVSDIYEKGVQQGRKEVVERIEPILLDEKQRMGRKLINITNEIAKLKEWGIKNDK